MNAIRDAIEALTTVREAIARQLVEETTHHAEAPPAATSAGDGRGEAVPDETTGAAKAKRRWRPATTPVGWPPGRVRRVLRWAAALTLAATLAGAGSTGWLIFQQHRHDVAARQALDAARSYAVTLTTAGPATVDQQITALIDGSTGEFHDRFAKHSSQLRAMLLANNVTTRGEVVDVAVKSATTQQVTVLLLVRQTFTSAAAPDRPDAQPAPPDLTGMAMTVQKVHGQWLVSDIVPAEQQAGTP